jgi:DNA-binding NarL/FixJ family response regulator
MRFLLIDAFPMMRAAITRLLEQEFAGASVQGVDSAAAAWAALMAARPDAVLLDLRVDGGLELLQRMGTERVTGPILVVAGGDDVAEALRIVGLGAAGYVPERSDMATLERALRLVLAGGIYVPELARAAHGPPAAAPPAPDWDTLPLTPRQKDVLKLLTQGLSNKLIARELGVSVDTVKDHVAAVLKAMGVTSRTQAVLAATQARSRV